MPILDGDIKLLASERLSDNSDGGGRVTGNVILDGVSNNIFPDISELDRTYGRVNLRKVFAGVHTDDVSGYFGAHLILADAPDDPRVSATLFTTQDWTDTRANAVNRLESYLARGPRFEGYLYDQHIAGQKALLVLMRVDRPLPAVGATLAVVKDPGLATEQTQFVRITKVSSVARSFDVLNCATFTRQVVTLEISDPLLFGLEGGAPHCQDDTVQNIKSRLYTTVVANAARYYGIRPLAQAAMIGDLTVRADSLFSPLVPSAQTEIPIVDAKPHGDAVVYVPAMSGTVSVAVSTALSPTQPIFLGQGIYPGTLVITGGGYTLTDKDGLLMSGASQIGTVDYGAGVASLSAGGPTISAGKTCVFRPAAAPARAMQTAAWAVTAESRSGTIATILDPVPAPGSLAVHYMAQGRWYVLRDSGSGALRGSDAAHGSGVLNLVTGSVVATLGALPDVGSQVIFTYGLKVLDTDRSGATVQAFMDLTLDTVEAIVPGTVTVSWGAGLTATDDGAGNLTGAATGRIRYADRVIRFTPAILPAGGATLTVTADGSARGLESAIHPSHGGGRLMFNAGAAVRPKTLNIQVPVYFYYSKASNSSRIDKTVTLIDDGLGNVKQGGATVGTVNYGTGAVDIPDSYTLYASLMDAETTLVGDGYRYRALDKIPGNRTFSWSGADLSVSFGATGAAATLPAQQFTWAPVLDLTDGFSESIVPGSLRVAFAGKTLLDRNGALVMDVSHATGAGTACGAVDYASGQAQVAGAAVPGQANSATIQAMVTTLHGHPVDEVTFRAAAAPLRPGSLVIQFAHPSTGAPVTVTAGTDGIMSASNVQGAVDYQTGIVRVRFGAWITAAGNEGEDWYLAAAVRGDGKIFRPAPVLAETLRYAAVAYAYLPLDATILGLNPVRLPSDGKVPIFAPGYVAVVHHTATRAGTYSAGQTVDLGRARIARVRVLDAEGAVVSQPGHYTTDLDAGTLTFTSVAGLSQPLTIEDRIEDMGLISDAQINGQLTLTRPITHDYPVPGSQVSSALIVGDMSARATGLFEQSAWTGVWSDSLIGSEPTASFNEIQYPITVTNRGAIQERWALIFTNTTSFRVVGQSIGEIANGNTSTNLAPINPATGVPYFTLNPLGWGAGWSAGNVLRFNTIAASYPVWIARTIQQGPATEDRDSFTLQIRGDIDAP